MRFRMKVWWLGAAWAIFLPQLSSCSDSGNSTYVPSDDASGAASGGSSSGGSSSGNGGAAGSMSSGGTGEGGTSAQGGSTTGGSAGDGSGGNAGSAAGGGAAGSAGQQGNCPPGMAEIPGATFTLGAGATDLGITDPTEVTVSTFCMDLTEVTVSAYAACPVEEGCTRFVPDLGCSMELNHPINCVSDVQAAAYCTWMNKRLPSEAEWELAARGPEGRAYPWGAAAPADTLLNWCGENAQPCDADGYQYTAPVGTYPAGNTPLGLADLSGNLFEFTSSFNCPYSNPSCGDTAVIIRGGSFDDSNPNTFRAAYRWPFAPGSNNIFTGFRCAD